MTRASIAQLDRAAGYGPAGLGFESLWMHHFFYLDFEIQPTAKHEFSE